MTIQDIMDIQQDKRFTLNKEYCGYSKPLFCVRFFGEFISSHADKNDAYRAAVEYNKNRLKN